MAKKIEELEQEIARLEQENERLDLENVRLLGRNLLMSEQLNSWYELRQRVGWLKAEMERGRRLSMQADLVDDAELLAMLENRLENEPQLVTADFGAKELAELMGVSQARLMRLFRNSTIFRSADEYLENLRLVRDSVSWWRNSPLCDRRIDRNPTFVARQVACRNNFRKKINKA